MTARLRTAALAVAAAAGLLVAPIALAGSASAAPANVSQVLFFSNDTYTDPDDEDATEIAGLQAGGATVTVFDGGDGTGAAWSAALAGKHALVVPESSALFGSPILDDAGEDALFAFVNGGGKLVLPTENQEELISFLTGVDYVSVWSFDETGDPAFLQVENPAFPAQVTFSDGTYPVVGIDAWNPEQLAAVTPLYLSEDGLQLHAGQWTVGAGSIYVLAYDWYPGDDEGDEEGRALWNQLLQAITYVAAAELADTGIEASWPVLTGALALLVLGGAAFGVARTRRP
jgi:hypothetical protein